MMRRQALVDGDRLLVIVDQHEVGERAADVYTHSISHRFPTGIQNWRRAACKGGSQAP
jgi:hypothetical protein